MDGCLPGCLDGWMDAWMDACQRHAWMREGVLCTLHASNRPPRCWGWNTLDLASLALRMFHLLPKER